MKHPPSAIPRTNRHGPAVRRRSVTARQRRGAIYFAELVLVMPIFMIMLLAVVQFGIFFTNLQTLDFASRVGAEAASETSVVGGVPGSVISAVEQQLSANDIALCKVLIELPGGSVEDGSCDCSPSSFNPPLGAYVRVTVCVNQSELMPNLLAPFGYDISGADQVVSCSTTMQREF